MDGSPFIIGQHPLIQKIHALIKKVTATDATVLVMGESGTGKELVARAIHALSPRNDRPFIPVNCGAIPAELLESEIFGHERGAFTGAIGARAGMFQLANGGTIFLDEVGEMSPPLQVKLLRVLQDQEIRPVGADRTMKVDVRVIAATNKDLQQEVERGAFREDLYYRLQVIPIIMPHLLERMVILSEDASIRVETLPSNIRSFISEKRIPKPSLTASGLDLNSAVEEFENRLIEEALRRTKGNKQAAARLLGLKRTTLVAKLRRRKGEDVEEDEATE